MDWKAKPDERVARSLAALAEQAVRSHPDRPGGWTALAGSHAAAGRDAEAIDVLRRGAASVPHAAPLRLMLAQRLRASGEYEEALLEVREALRLEPGRAEAVQLLFFLLVKTGRGEEAAPLAEEVARHDPAEPYLFEHWGPLARDEAALRALVRRCDDALASRPGAANAVYFKALALAKLGDAAAARALLSTHRLVEVRDLPPPAGLSPGAWHEALAAAVGAHPGLAPPVGKSTESGLQTPLLREADGDALAALIAALRAAARDYADRLPAGSLLATSQPAAADLAVWGVVLGAEGRQRSHRHPDGWLSGVFYVAAPKRADGAGHAGPLRLGAIEPREGIDPPWGVREIEPLPGRLVLFPSFMPHATAPSGVEGERISIAFDVVPRPPDA